MRGAASFFGMDRGSRWVRLAACAAACAWASAPAFAQQEPAATPDGGEPVLLALGPTLPLDPVKAQRGLSLDVRPSLPSPTLAPQSTDIGLKWRQPFGSHGNTVDIAAWRRSTPPTDALSMIREREPVFGARLEFRLTSGTSRFVSDLKEMRFIGLQLDSGARLGIRRMNGNPTLYYRMTF